MGRQDSRLLGDLTFPEVSRQLKPTSVLLLPLGAFEQHGPHLPLGTDTVIAEELTRRIVAKWGDAFDLWQLPTLSVSLSREHDWAPGTLCLTIEHFISILRDLAGEIVRSLPARNLAIVNGHGGNRGVLETLVRDLGHERGLNVCVIHPFDLTKVKSSGPDVHGGKSETSVMLALAPHLVRKEKIARPAKPADPAAIEALILERGTTWPWRSDDPRLAHQGVIGDAHAASPEFGRRIVDSIVTQSRGVFQRLLETQRLLQPGPAASAPVRVDLAKPIAPRLRRRVTRARTSRRSGSPTPRPPRKKS